MVSRIRLKCSNVICSMRVWAVSAQRLVALLLFRMIGLFGRSRVFSKRVLDDELRPLQTRKRVASEGRFRFNPTTLALPSRWTYTDGF
jgi:hypothetical protein